jgi:hypothetical protein
LGSRGSGTLLEGLLPIQLYWLRVKMSNINRPMT